MPKIRTLTQLQETLDAEMGWRVKEIASLKLMAKSDGVNGKMFVRAGVALVYAHWEGFIKSASESYLNFVDNQGHVYRDLKTCFAVFGLKGKLAMLAGSRQTKPNIEAFDFVLTELDKPARMSMSAAIDTESNLTSRVFANIATSLDIATAGYETKYNLIDESLVKRRNKVAHGEYLDLEVNDFRTLADEILQMMRDYKTDLQNAASMATYRRPMEAALLEGN
ncbi:MAE_28990/MAE_18760 family HEPN-like nuclease [Mesorhizobium sp. M0217]|uniref:MAE_28990/MAE_18760 family HEPN-like nuclease n=1 Tax=unclassified Mesorhizobium TaxID=325217 RepID=UPI003339D3BE